MTRRPNVLFIICDQLRADHLGYAGNTVVRTPHIDAIAAGGTVFERGVVANPVCMPNRATLMTGRMPSAHGVIFNDRSLRPDHTTFVGQLRDAGYGTALLGKSHLQHGLSRDAWVDLQQDPGMHSVFEEGWDTIEHQERYEAGETVAPDDFYGFGHIELSIGHGAWTGGHHYQWALERGATRAQLRDALDPHADWPDRSPNWWQVVPAPFDADLYSTSYVTDRAIDFIETSEAGGAPWMAWCSYPDPHHPMNAPEPWFSRHDPADMELPPTFGDDGDGMLAHQQFIRSLEPSDRRWVVPFGPTREQALDALAATYGMIEMIDDGVGQITATLDRLGVADDTIIVFTSDHGDMMGDHGLMLKGAMHYKGCIDTPIVVKAPGKAPGRTTSLASSIDLPQTLLDLCGVADYQGMQGHSLVPILDDNVASVRDSALIEDDYPVSALHAGVPLKTRTVVTDRFRYTRDSDGGEQLFDLSVDPDELYNLALNDRSPAARAEVMEVLADELIRADDITRLEPVSL